MTNISLVDVERFIIDNPKMIDEVLAICYQHHLTKRDKEILDKVHYSKGRYTSIDLSKDLNISIQCASNCLTKLFMRGYCMRVDMSAPSGGKMYEYLLTKKGYKYVD